MARFRTTRVQGSAHSGGSTLLHLTGVRRPGEKRLARAASGHPDWVLVALAAWLLTGLFVSGPFIAAWKRRASPAGWSEWLPVLLSLALTLSLITFLTQYSNPLVVTLASSRPSHEYDEALGAVGILLHTIILMSGILIAITRWTLPPGSLTLVLTVNVVGLSFMRSRFFLIPAIVLAAAGAGLLL